MEDDVEVAAEERVGGDEERVGRGEEERTERSRRLVAFICAGISRIPETESTILVLAELNFFLKEFKSSRMFKTVSRISPNFAIAFLTIFLDSFCRTTSGDADFATLLE